MKRLALLVSLLCALPSFGATLEDAEGWPEQWPVVKGFKGGHIIREGIASEPAMPWRFYAPPIADPSKPEYDPYEKLPLIVHLAGQGATGSDNRFGPYGASKSAPPGAAIWAAPWMPEKYRAFVLAPQKGIPSWGAIGQDLSLLPLTLLVINELSREYNIDRNRIYLTGNSAGARGVWGWIWRRPHYFAAAIISSGRTSAEPHQLRHLEHLPIWAVHGTEDKKVSIDSVEEAVTVLPQMIFTRVIGARHSRPKHVVWPFKYKKPNTEMFDWLFSQTNKRRVHHRGQRRKK